MTVCQVADQYQKLMLLMRNYHLVAES
jgi:hypothetical protein